MDCDDLRALPGCEDFTDDLVDAVLEEAGKICEEVLLPLNRSGDEEGCTIENGVVRTPKGFKEAYDLFREGGWTGARLPTRTMAGRACRRRRTLLVEEMICSANLSFGMYPGLTHGAYEALRSTAREELKTTYLPKLVDGDMVGHHVPDRAALRHRPRPDPHQGRAAATTAATASPARKIFISAGEHDLTENIIHLVLAKLPDAPKGTRGISLFLVPKFLPNADGTPGERNGVRCGAIEHKMGIKATATCVMNFDDAMGWLVGEPHQGHERHVHHDERRRASASACRASAWPKSLPERGGLCARTACRAAR